MAKSNATLVVKIISDAKNASQGFDYASSKVGKFQSGLTKVAAGATVVGAGLLGIATQAGKSASELQQARGAVESVFGSQAAKVEEFASKASKSVGLAHSEYSSMASVLGAQLKNLNIPSSELVGTTDGLIRKGADLAATFGGTTAEAVEALTAAFRGETDPIEKYGIAIKEADVKAQLAKDGTDKLTGAAGKQARAMAILKLINEQSKDATGQFAREQNTAAGATQIARASFEDAKASLGEALLPAMAKLAETAANAARFVQDHSGELTKLGIVIAGIIGTIYAAQGASMAWSIAMGLQAAATGAGTASIAGNTLATGAYAVATGVAKTATTVWTGVQWLLNAALSANPLALVVIAIAGFVTAVVLAYKKVGWFRDAVNTAWQWIKNASVSVWNFLKGFIPKTWQGIVWAFKNLSPVGIIVSHWGQIKTASRTAWEWIKSTVKRIWQGIVWAFKNLSPVGIIITHWGRIKTATSTAWQAVKNTVSNWLNRIIGSIRNFAPARFISNAFFRIPGITRNAFVTMYNAVVVGKQRALAALRSLPSQIWRALGNMSNTLFNSGQNLIYGFIRGIYSQIGRVANAARDVVNRARNFFPFSPAKEGPFSGSGYTTHSGKALVSDFALAIRSQRSKVASAINAVNGSAVITGSSKVPTFTANAGLGVGSTVLNVAPGAIVVNSADTGRGRLIGEDIVRSLEEWARNRGVRLSLT